MKAQSDPAGDVAAREAPSRRRNRHPRKVDRDEAFAYWAGLGPDRKYAQVARFFGCAESSVKRWAREEGWVARLEELEAEQRAKTDALVVKSWEERKRDTLEIVQLARSQFRQQLVEKGYVLDAKELAALLRIEALLEGQATERVDVQLRVEIAATLRETVTIALDFIPTELRLAFLERFEDRIGRLDHEAGPAGELAA